MTGRRERVIRIALVAGLVAGLLTVGAGCSTLGSSHRADLPANVKVVGGGFEIIWQAPQGGTAYVVEKTSGKILKTETLSEDEWFEYEVDQEDGGAVFKMTTGVDLANARIVLYFQPASE